MAIKITSKGKRVYEFDFVPAFLIPLDEENGHGATDHYTIADENGVSNCIFQAMIFKRVSASAEEEDSRRKRGAGERRAKEGGTVRADGFLATLEDRSGRLDAGLLLRPERRIPCDPVHEVNQFPHDWNKRPFRGLRAGHSLFCLGLVVA